MSTYELNFGVPYGVTTARVYLDVLTPVDADRQYVVGLRAMAGDRVVDLDSPGWHYSKHLQTKFCYLPRRSEPGMAKLPLLTVGREVTHLEVQPLAWARGSAPVEEVVGSVWLATPDPAGGTTIFEAVSRQEGENHV
ncbi:hypothetical protein [Terrabacter sp. NPDC000476]|uniref:hypothetical protein n=1 Tax=Terrabacter sp. NPDC000476 TaxID=3154258 RepID=UPI00332B4F19